eukprot:3029984-Rhodomonas_salina.3
MGETCSSRDRDYARVEAATEIVGSILRRRAILLLLAHPTCLVCVCITRKRLLPTLADKDRVVLDRLRVQGASLELAHVPPQRRDLSRHILQPPL